MTTQSDIRIGIEKIAIYPCTMAIDMATLVAARGQNTEDVCGEMMISERSVNPPWEDPVTMAVNAATRLLLPEDREAISLLLVGTETGLDQEKSLSTWVHRHLNLRDDCRNLELKHACYAGTAALRLAAAWLLAHPDRNAKALVITTDQSRAHFGKPYEFVMGAGSVALLVSRQPDFFALDFDLGGVYACEVADLIRPTSQVEAGHSETSLLSYLDAADITFDRYNESLKRARGIKLESLTDLRSWFQTQVYHAPFGGITLRAHKAVLRSLAGFDRAYLSADYDERVKPTLEFNRRMGGTYASSVFVSLAAAASFERSHDSNARCGVYSYGSGSCAEFFSGCFGDKQKTVRAGAEVRTALANRKLLTVDGYEAAERERSLQVDNGDFRVDTSGHESWYRERYASQGLLTLAGADDFVRHYAWS